MSITPPGSVAGLLKGPLPLLLQELAETAAERSKRAEAAAIAERNRVVYETNMNLESVQKRALEAQQQAEARDDPVRFALAALARSLRALSQRCASLLLHYRSESIPHVRRASRFSLLVSSR